MRTLKFRGISLDTNKWIYGYGVIQHPNGLEASIIHKQGINETQHTAVDPKTIGQFTGFTDENNTEIYEADVVFCQTLSDANWGLSKLNHVVGFSSGTFCLFENGEKSRQWNDGYNEWYSIENMDGYDFCVVGNIHENPELLR